MSVTACRPARRPNRLDAPVSDAVGDTRRTGLGEGPYEHRRGVGRLGEELATRFIVSRGGTILGRNVRVGRGEIDIHARIDGATVAVEVKTVLGGDGSHDAVGQFSRRKALTVARYASLLRPPAYRVDLIAVTVREGRADVHWIPFAC